LLADYYALLGVLPTAEAIVIRAAYKALALRYHPDRFEGSPEEAQHRMAELNEAYAVLNDSERRAEYDERREPGTQAGDCIFGDEASEAPPDYDPLEGDWAVAVKYYGDLPAIEARLAKISWRLAYSYRAYMLSEKRFLERNQVAEALEAQFLELYFGSDPKITAFAKQLISEGNRASAKVLNRAVCVLGDTIDASRVIGQILQEARKAKQASEPGPSDHELMQAYGIYYDGEKYQYRQYRYDKLDDAVSYARLSKDR
jgi:curved DNA-binding protein CbpA